MRTPRPWSLPTAPITAAQLGASGVSPAMIATRLASGELRQLRRGVYVAASAYPQDQAQRHLLIARAELAVHPDGALSHQSAALIWELPHPGFLGWQDQPPALTLPQGRHHRGVAGPVEHHVADLPTQHLAVSPAGVPVTNLPRTAIDLSTDLPLPEALVILDAAARRLCAGFLARPRRSDYRNHRLVAAARDALLRTAAERRRRDVVAAIMLADPCRESPAESLSAGHFHQAGLPAPQFQAAVRTAAGVFFPDCLWQADGLIGECDGKVKYQDASAFAAEKTREQALRDTGLRMVRWQAAEIMTRPEAVVDRVARALHPGL